MAGIEKKKRNDAAAGWLKEDAIYIFFYLFFSLEI
jgi:hypothetical protein